MVTYSKDGWNDDVVYCGYSDDEGPRDASVVSARPRPHRRDDCRPELLRVQEGTIHRRCDDAVLYHPCPEGIGAMGLGGRHPGLFRACILMPPSRTHETCLRSHIAPPGW